MSASRRKLPLESSKSNFRFTPESEHNSAIAACPKCAARCRRPHRGVHVGESQSSMHLIGIIVAGEEINVIEHVAMLFVLTGVVVLQVGRRTVDSSSS